MAGNSNSGRKAKPNGKRTSIIVDQRVVDYLRQQGSGNTSLGAELVVFEKMYGTTFVKGAGYFTLTDQADFTNRVLSASSLDYYDDNEYFEMSAPAINNKGEKFTVYWIFRKVEDWELDQYDYSKPCRVESAD